MDVTKDIQRVTSFRNNSAEVMRHLRDSKRPVILTVNGKAAAILQDPESYQRLLDLAIEANTAEGFRQTLKDLRNRLIRQTRSVVDGIRSKHDRARDAFGSDEPDADA